MVTVHKTKAKGKGHNTDQTFLYINLMDFKDETEQDIYFRKIEEIIKDRNTKVRVY